MCFSFFRSHPTIGFQYISDIHLECYKPHSYAIRTMVNPTAPYLLVAGDIASPFHVNTKFFFDYYSPQFKHIFFTAGNHCYYKDNSIPINVIGDWMSFIDDQFKKLAITYPNVTYLQDQSYHIPNTDISIFGCTLWTPISNSRSEAVQKSMTDYIAIPNFSTRISTQLWQNSVVALEAALHKYSDRRWIVMSHHIPQKSLIHPKFAKYVDINEAFASDVSFAHDPCIEAWVYGHTHTPVERGKYYCNPNGYPMEELHPMEEDHLNTTHTDTSNKVFHLRV